MNRERFSIIIPNWNGSSMLKDCLFSLQEQSFQNFSIYVVDNGSVDDSVSMVQKLFPEVNLITLKENTGFSKAVNIGFDTAQGEYLIALNNDTTQDPNWLKEADYFFRLYPEAGLAASKSIDFKDRKTIDSVGDIYTILGFANHIGSGEIDQGQYDNIMEVFTPSGVASIYKKSLIEKIGGLDEDFFAYMEDVDLGIRARLAGYRCFIIPKAIVYHIGSATSSGGFTPFTIRLTSRNMISVMIKNMPIFLLPIMFFLFFSVYFIYTLADLILGFKLGIIKNFNSMMLGFYEAFLQLPLMLKKRKENKKLQQVSNWAWTQFIFKQSYIFFKLKILKHTYQPVQDFEHLNASITKNKSTSNCSPV